MKFEPCGICNKDHMTERCPTTFSGGSINYLVRPAEKQKLASSKGGRGKAQAKRIEKVLREIRDV